MAKSGLRHIDVGAELTKTEWESEESHELIHGTSFPGSPVERQLFYRDDEHKWYIYNGSSWTWLGAAGGGGDMLKSVYDTADNGIVDNAEKLEGSTKAQVQDHTPKAHTLASHSSKAHSELTGVGAADHHVKYTDAEAKAQAEAAKLDDHAAPDDNTDLDATALKHGLMPKADKSKLDGVESGATKYPDTGEQAFLDADHTKLDGVEAGADVTANNDPKAHKASHEDGGSDEMSIAGLAGEPAALTAHAADKDAHHSNVLTLTFVIDGGGSAITTGQKGHLEIPFACTINQVTLLADQSGSIVVDIWKDTYANFPPTDADSITASAPPTLSSVQKSQDSTLTGWTTAITAGDILAFNVDSCSTITRVTLSLKVTKS